MSDQTTPRKPLLSDERLWYRNNQDDMEQLEGHEVRKFYEAKITSGELRVVDHAEIRKDETCSRCGEWLFIESDPGQYVDPEFKFCPECGSKIKR